MGANTEDKVLKKKAAKYFFRVDIVTRAIFDMKRHGRYTGRDTNIKPIRSLGVRGHNILSISDEVMSHTGE